MPLFRNFGPPRWKPPLGAGVNWGHPLARNLVAGWLLNEFGGMSNSRSLVNANDILSFQDFSGGGFLPQWRSMPDARGGVLDFYAPTLLNSSARPCAQILSPSSDLLITDAVTIFWAGTFLADSSSTFSAPVAEMGHNSSFNSPFNAYGFERDTSDQKKIDYVHNIGGTQHVLVSAAEVVYGQFTSLAFSFESGSQIGYMNGLQSVTASNSGSIQYGTNPPFSMNNWPNNVINNGSAKTIALCCYIWHRFLSPCEHQWLHLEPFAMIENNAPLRGLYTVPPVVSPFVPYFDPMPQLLPQ